MGESKSFPNFFSMKFLRSVFFALKVRFTSHYLMFFTPILQLYIFYLTIFKGMEIHFGKYNECEKGKFFMGGRFEILLIALFGLLISVIGFTYFNTFFQWTCFVLCLILLVYNKIKYKKFFIPK
jgi:hypothetical protein